MNLHPDHQYQTLLQDLLVHGDQRDERTGTGAASLFGRQMRFDLTRGFPLLTTKKLPFRVIAEELFWFLSGSTNNNDLHARGVTIWDEWAAENGDLGPIYGKQWRSWAAPDGRSIDQIAKLIHGLKTNPFGRRHIVSAWNPADIDDMALPPCHCLFQFFVSSDGKLSCQLYQRSADIFLGVPFNIASYALLTHMVAAVCGYKVGEFIHTFGDVHLYDNHREQAIEQLRRTPKLLPGMTLWIKPDIDSFKIDDLVLLNYDAHPHIPAEVAV